MPKVAVVLGELLRLAPRELAEPWDNVGLLCGDSGQEAAGALVCLDPTPEALQEAARLGANLVISHHPLFIQPQRAFTADGLDTAAAVWAVAAGLSVICLHTNLDLAPGGLGCEVAGRLGLTGLSPVVPVEMGALQKLVVFVPETHREQMLAAIADAGAGVIGKYDYCSFSTPGTGTFRALPGAQPFLGQVGEIARATEVRLETVVPKAIAGRVIKAMLAAHPYEEVAFDLYALENPWPGAGLGALGRLPGPMSAQELLDHVTRVLGGPVRAAGERAQVERVAVIPGGAGRYVTEAAQAGAEALVTGEASHHDALRACQLGVLLVVAGHYQTEIPAVALIARWCREAFPGLAVHEHPAAPPWSRE